MPNSMNGRLQRTSQGAEMALSVRGLRKRYGKFLALDGVNFDIPRGAICGLIGPNGAGKTTALKSLIGLCEAEGELSVVGHDPRVSRAKLMNDACFIADVGILPRALRAIDIINYVDFVHPKFNRGKALGFLANTDIQLKKRVSSLSKGIVTQLHLAIVMAIDVELLILDEPTLGLDIIYRKEFYDRLLTQFYDGSQTIVISTHQVEEIESLLSHLIFLKNGKVMLNMDMETISSTFVEVDVVPESYTEAEGLGPIAIRPILGGRSYLYESPRDETIDIEKLRALGEVSTPSIAD
jgi:ABC-2 type transport system ATP-binding protein